MAKGEGASLRSMLVNSSRTLGFALLPVEETTDHPSSAEPRLLVESEVAASDQCLPRELNNAEAYTEIFIRLLDQLFWVFNVREIEGQWRDWWRKYVEDRVGK